MGLVKSAISAVIWLNGKNEIVLLGVFKSDSSYAASSSGAVFVELLVSGVFTG